MPELNRPFQKMLEAADNENETINSLKKASTKPSEELLSLRKQAMSMTAEIVHGTDYQGGQEKIPAILQIHERFRKAAGH